jgi:hypothetical protein
VDVAFRAASREQRLFIRIQRGEAGAEPFIFSFGLLKLRR